MNVQARVVLSDAQQQQLHEILGSNGTFSRLLGDRVIDVRDALIESRVAMNRPESIDLHSALPVEPTVSAGSLSRMAISEAVRSWTSRTNAKTILILDDITLTPGDTRLDGFNLIDFENEVLIAVDPRSGQDLLGHALQLTSSYPLVIAAVNELPDTGRWTIAQLQAQANLTTSLHAMVCDGEALLHIQLA